MVVLLAAAACSTIPVGAGANGFLSEDVTIASRGVGVPATFVRPSGTAASPFPIVVLAHGHGGTRDESGGFRRLAEALAQRGIATIRPDFPGCGQSNEPFTRNNLSNMMADTRAALAYVSRKPEIDANRTGIVGYSMGARVAMLVLPDGYAAAVLWAPVGLDGPGAVFPLIGGQSSYLELRKRAQSAGVTPFVTPWGQHQNLGRKWFDDLETYQPMRAVRSFTGALLVISGADDAIIEPDIPRAVAAAATSSDFAHVEILAGAGHGLGFYDENPAVSEHVIEATSDLLVSALFRER
jgi:dienelactone hydrolase